MGTLTFHTALKHTALAVSRYGLVGVVCAILNLGIVYVGHNILYWHYVIAVLGTCLITIPISYILHRQFTFRAIGSADLPEFRRFCITQLSQFSIGLLILSAFVELIHWPVIAAMLLVTVIQFMYGFMMSSTWVFGSVRRDDTTRNVRTHLKR